jgi:hypothetical protein
MASKLIEIQVLFFFLLFFLQIFYIYPAKAQVEILEILLPIFTTWIGWILLLVGGIILIIISYVFATYVRLSKILFRLGIVLLVISLFLAEFAYVFPLLTKDVNINYEKCKEVKLDDLASTASCIITGYVPVASSSEGFTITLVSFWITILIILSILIYIFYDFVEASGIIGSGAAKRVIAFGFGFLAFRGVLASQFINFFSYGMFGIALLIINFIIAGGLFTYAGRFFGRFEVLEAQVERRGAIRMAELNLKEFFKNVKAAPNPLKFFFENSTHVKTYFDVLGISDDYEKLNAYVINNKEKEFKELVEDILKKLK